MSRVTMTPEYFRRALNALFAHGANACSSGVVRPNSFDDAAKELINDLVEEQQLRQLEDDTPNEKETTTMSSKHEFDDASILFEDAQRFGAKYLADVALLVEQKTICFRFIGGSDLLTVPEEDFDNLFNVMMRCFKRSIVNQRRAAALVIDSFNKGETT